MTFAELPQDWPQRPVTDPAITADLLDLVVGDRDRHEGAVGLLLCGPSGRLLQPVVVSVSRDEVQGDDYRRVFDVMAQALGDHPDGARPPGLASDHVPPVRPDRPPCPRRRAAGRAAHADLRHRAAR